MHPNPDNPTLWTADVPALHDGVHHLTVEAQGSDGVDRDTITVATAGSPRTSPGPILVDHRQSVGAWVERGLLGTRLGPNANGRKW